jgi:hypothetical protein
MEQQIKTEEALAKEQLDLKVNFEQDDELLSE